MAATQTAGMQLQTQKQQMAIDNLRGDLAAIAILRRRARRPVKHVGVPRSVKEIYAQLDGVTFEGKKKLWNAQSRLISQVVKSHLPIENPNSIESILLRELVGLASVGLDWEGLEKELKNEFHSTPSTGL